MEHAVTSPMASMKILLEDYGILSCWTKTELQNLSQLSDSDSLYQLTGIGARNKTGMDEDRNVVNQGGHRN